MNNLFQSRDFFAYPSYLWIIYVSLFLPQFWVFPSDCKFTILTFFFFRIKFFFLYSAHEGLTDYWHFCYMGFPGCFASLYFQLILLCVPVTINQLIWQPSLCMTERLMGVLPTAQTPTLIAGYSSPIVKLIPATPSTTEKAAHWLVGRVLMHVTRKQHSFNMFKRWRKLWQITEML